MALAWLSLRDPSNSGTGMSMSRGDRVSGIISRQAACLLPLFLSKTKIPKTARSAVARHSWLGVMATKSQLNRIQEIPSDYLQLQEYP